MTPAQYVVALLEVTDPDARRAILDGMDAGQLRDALAKMVTTLREVDQAR